MRVCLHLKAKIVTNLCYTNTNKVHFAQIFDSKGDKPMKKSKILAFISIILCLSMLFVACTTNENEDQNEQPTDNPSANIDKIVSELNKGETADELYKNVMDEVDYRKIINDVAAELKKVSASGKAQISVTEDDTTIAVNADLAIKNNTAYANVTANNETLGLYAELSDKLLFSAACWDKDEEADYDAAAFDLDKMIDELEDMIKSATSEEAPVSIDLTKIPLVQITADDIKYEDGKYVVSKEYIIKLAESAADGVIDSIKNSGEANALPENFEEQYNEIKAQIKNLINAMELKLYYLAKNEVIEGMGIELGVKGSDIVTAFEMEENMLGFDNIKVSAEFNINGAMKASMEYKETDSDFVNKISYEFAPIMDGKNICGLILKCDANIQITSEHYSNITNIDLDVVVDLSKIDEANATVADIKATTSSEMKGEYYHTKYDENGNPIGEELDESYTSVDNGSFTLSLKTTEANKLDLNMNFKEESKRTSSIPENSREDNEEITVTGTIEIKTGDDVTIPEIDAEAKTELENAKKNPLTSFGGQEAP